MTEITPEMKAAAKDAYQAVLWWPLDRRLNDAITAALAAAPAPQPVAVKPLDMFMNNVDAWGAAEWFGRMADAVRGHDDARVSGDEFADIEAETFKNIMTSSAFTLVRDYEQQVRAALVSATPAEIDRLKAENERLAKDMAYAKAAFETAVVGFQTRITELEACEKRMREALEFYAVVDDYKAPFTGGMGKLWSDCGAVARSALAKEGE